MTVDWDCGCGNCASVVSLTTVFWLDVVCVDRITLNLFFRWVQLIVCFRYFISIGVSLRLLTARRRDRGMRDFMILHESIPEGEGKYSHWGSLRTILHDSCCSYSRMSVLDDSMMATPDSTGGSGWFFWEGTGPIICIYQHKNTVSHPS